MPYGADGEAGDLWSNHDQRPDGLAPFLIGNTNHRRFQHPRVFIKYAFHLDGIDILPTADDHVFLTIHDVDVAFQRTRCHFLHPGNVAQLHLAGLDGPRASLAGTEVG